MQHLGIVMLYESHVRELDQEAEMIRLGAELPRPPIPWRAIIITAVVLVGMAAWLVH